jgi:hypothetical protein
MPPAQTSNTILSVSRIHFSPLGLAPRYRLMVCTLCQHRVGAHAHPPLSHLLLSAHTTRRWRSWSGPSPQSLHWRPPPSWTLVGPPPPQPPPAASLPSGSSRMPWLTSSTRTCPSPCPAAAAATTAPAPPVASPGRSSSRGAQGMGRRCSRGAAPPRLAGRRRRHSSSRAQAGASSSPGLAMPLGLPQPQQPL